LDPDDNPRFAQFVQPSLPLASSQTTPVAPAWHTLVLIVGIVAISIHGASRFSAPHPSVNRLVTYALTGAMELALLGWVIFGLRLKKNSLRSLLGSNPVTLRSIALDVGIAFIFWIGSLMVLMTLALTWMVAQAAIAHRPLIPPNGQPDPSQQQAVHALVQLAPANPEEIAAWALLCMLVGFVEETVFRGYLQRQFTAWARGAVTAGIVFSAIVFGAAHAYQGARNMCLLAVFGALFSLLALFRRSLRAGMFAHSGHDLIAGLTLALLKAHRII
jgi:membrane protease YdiL (CAAX protease family)